MDNAEVTKGRRIDPRQTRRFDINEHVELAQPKTSPLDKGTPRPWRIGINIIQMGIELIIDLTDNVLIGRSYPDTEFFPGIDLSPFEAYKKGVSRRHAMIRLQERRVVVVDNDSANGTLLNGERLEPGREYALRNGDQLRLGALDLQVALLLNPFDIA